MPQGGGCTPAGRAPRGWGDPTAMGGCLGVQGGAGGSAPSQPWLRGVWSWRWGPARDWQADANALRGLWGRGSAGIMSPT